MLAPLPPEPQLAIGQQHLSHLGVRSFDSMSGVYISISIYIYILYILYIYYIYYHLVI